MIPVRKIRRKGPGAKMSREKEINMGKCNGFTCGRSWKSLTEAHCSGCHEHFRSVSAFDKHRVGSECLSHDEMKAKGMFYDDTAKRWAGSKMPNRAFCNRVGTKNDKTTVTLCSGMGQEQTRLK